MSLEDKFHRALNEWKEHCYRNRHHSISEPYLNCDAYRTIVAMGPEVLPLIKEEYAKPQGVGDPGIHWCYALKEIVPELSLPIGEKDSGSPVEKVASEIAGLDVNEVQKATIQWLDENMRRYVSSL